MKTMNDTKVVIFFIYASKYFYFYKYFLHIFVPMSKEVTESSIDECQQIAPYVDAILLDSGNPNLKIKELGGTGRVHDWKLSRRIVESVSVPVFLAGGLNADNVRTAILEVGPFGLDLCSGVRTDGRLDERKLEQFFKNLN